MNSTAVAVLSPLPSAVTHCACCGVWLAAPLSGVRVMAGTSSSAQTPGFGATALVSTVLPDARVMMTSQAVPAGTVERVAWSGAIVAWVAGAAPIGVIVAETLTVPHVSVAAVAPVSPPVSPRPVLAFVSEAVRRNVASSPVPSTGRIDGAIPTGVTNATPVEV